MNKEDEKIDKNIIYLGLVSFFTDFSSSMINPILPIFIVSILHSGIDKLGIIVAFSTFISYFLRLFSGYISDCFHIVKPMVVSGYLISAISKPLFSFSTTWESVAVIKGVERLHVGHDPIDAHAREDECDKTQHSDRQHVEAGRRE